MPRARCVIWACTKLKLKLGYDDSLDVFGIHGVGGATGTLLAGVFATAAVTASPDAPNGLAGLIDGNPNQILLQLYGIGVTLVWCGVASFVLLKVISFFLPLRVRDEDERMGLDITQHGESIHS